MIVTTQPCPFCGKVHQLELTNDQYRRIVERKEHIQDILLGWPASKRELLISGTCPECWDEYMKCEDEI